MMPTLAKSLPVGYFHSMASELNSGQLWVNLDILNPGPPDYKSSTLNHNLDHTASLKSSAN